MRMFNQALVGSFIVASVAATNVEASVSTEAPQDLDQPTLQQRQEAAAGHISARLLTAVENGETPAEAEKKGFKTLIEAFQIPNAYCSEGFDIPRERVLQALDIVKERGDDPKLTDEIYTDTKARLENACKVPSAP